MPIRTTIERTLPSTPLYKGAYRGESNTIHVRFSELELPPRPSAVGSPSIVLVVHSIYSLMIDYRSYWENAHYFMSLYDSDLMVLNSKNISFIKQVTEILEEYNNTNRQ